jgi:hypoxanthine phosphoribosyltransferase
MLNWVILITGNATGDHQMKKQYYTWDDVHRAAHKIALSMYNNKWKPDYIVGLNRGGLPLSVIISHLLNCNHYTLNVRLRDGDNGPESNLWMSEEAFGYNYADVTGVTGARWDIKQRKNILIVDDINDTGSTFNWIKRDWTSSCFPDETDAWNSVWNNNVRFAAMFEKKHTKFEGVDYAWQEIDTSEEDTWVVFPWEYDTNS